MRVITWNVNSLKARLELVELLLDEVQPDLLALQELKLPTDQVPEAPFAARGYTIAVAGQRQYNGVLLASRGPLAAVTLGAPGEEGQARVVQGEVAGVRVVNVYCPQGAAADSDKFAYKLRFYDALCDWLAAQPGLERTLLVGDLNVARAPRDLWDPIGMAGVPTFHPEEHQRWDALLALGLRDVVEPRVPPGTYTFWDYRGLAFPLNQGMRIDHVLAGADLAGRVTRAEVLRGWRKKRGAPSDHAPVLVELASPAAPAEPR
jgi:exodeoxyribonuclease-3